MNRVLCAGLLMMLAGAVALAQSPVPGAAVPAPDDPVIMTVNGEPLYATEVKLAMQDIAARAAERGMSPEQDDKLMEYATRQAVDLRLLAQDAKRRGITPDQAKLDEVMGGIEGQAGGHDALIAALGKAGISLDRFRQEISYQLTVQRLVETKIAADIAVSNAEIAEYYNANPDRFNVAEQVRARHILLRIEADASPEAKATARAAAVKARERVLGGEDFAAVAKEVSQDGSAAQGGDLGVFTADMMVEPFSKAAFALQPGQVSDIVETQFGYHVIKLEERRAAGKRTLEEVTPRLRDGLKERKVGVAIEAQLDMLRKEAAIVPVGQAAEPAQPATTP